MKRRVFGFYCLSAGAVFRYLGRRTGYEVLHMSSGLVMGVRAGVIGWVPVRGKVWWPIVWQLSRGRLGVASGVAS